MSNSAQTKDEVRRLARELLPRALDISARVTEHVLQAVPELAPAGTPDAVRLVRESTDQNIGAMLSTLGFGITPTTIEVPAGTQDLLHNLTAGGGDVTHLLRAYRVGHQLLWHLWSEHVTAEIRDAAALGPVLDASSTHLFDFIDRTCQRIVRGAPEAWPGRHPAAPADRRQVVRSLLGSAPMDVRGAGAGLGYDISQHHVALLAAPVTATADVRGALDRLFSGVPARPFVIPSGDGSWWAWLGFPAAPGADTLAAIATAPVDSVLVGMGEPGRGRDGFRRSLAQAREAERIARLPQRVDAGVTRFRDIEIAAMLCGDPDRARALASDRLGALAGRDETGRRLRETLRALLANGYNRGQAARALHIHHKTVAYRINQAEQLLGRPITEDSYALETALLIDHTLHGP
ncbi:hypothetical protein GCM10023321_55400 [Pseudonocardia eucalypti]|uniref:DNA-binding PucR family transcriptional regulator n=1 Tax=Pseudonocardia eucalypti TaxID=648755 RepID=A0ABP9QPZ0_9PSEU|nr:hypothetical protein [Pseudonocardia eucalypti]